MYKLNKPYYSNGVQLSWTWPPPGFIGTLDPLLAVLYIQRSTTKSNWPLYPNFVKNVGAQSEPTPEADWETIATINVPPQFMNDSALDIYRTYTHNVPEPTSTTYYRIVGFMQTDVSTFVECDWKPDSIEPATHLPGETMWAKTLISNANGRNVKVLSVATDVSGNVAVTGTYMSVVDFGGLSLTNLSSQIQYFVAKYTPTGSLIWVQGVTSGTGLSVPSAVVMDSSGNVFTTGYFTVSVTINGNTLTTTGFEDIFVFKHAASDGSLSWHKEFGGTRSDYGRALVMDNSQHPIVIGNFSDSCTFGATTLVSAGGVDLFITKLSTNDGSVTFAKGYGGTGDENVYGAAADINGNIYIIGQLIGAGRFETGGTIYTATGAGDAFIVRYNSSGDYDGGSWVRQYGNTGYTYGFGIAVDNSATEEGGAIRPEVIATGSFQGTLSFGGDSRTALGGSAIFLLKLINSGTYITDAMYGGTSGGSDAGRSLAVDANRNIILCGTIVSSYSFGPTIDGGSIFKVGATPDHLVLKVDSSLRVLWVNRYGDTGFIDEALSVSVTSNANVLIGGFYNGSINLGTAGSFGSPYFNTQVGIFYKFQN